MSYFFALPGRVEEVRDLVEKSFLYIYFISLSILSLSTIIEYIKSRKEKQGISKRNALLLKAHTYLTRIIVLGLLVVFPLVIYFNSKYGWQLSDAVIVSIPTVILAMLIAEQNLYAYISAISDVTDSELAALASLRQVVDTMHKDPTSKTKIPSEKSIALLERSLERLEQRTREPDFARFASQAILTLDSIKTNNATEIWCKYIQRLHDDLKENNGATRGNGVRGATGSEHSLL